MPSAPRFDVLALGGLATLATAGIAFLVLHGTHAAANPLAAVPADSFLVVTLDVASIAQSPLGDALFGGDAGSRAESALGMDSAIATCGFDPLPHLRSLALTVPEGPMAGDRADFGVAMSATLGKDTLEACSKALITKRGGAPTVSQQGTFTVIGDANAPDSGLAAFRDGGPYLLGKGKWLTHMIDAVEGRAPSTLTATGDLHAALRADLATRDVDAEALRATVLLPTSLRAQLSQQMALEAHEDDRGTKTMQGVLGVSSAAFALHAGHANEDTRFTAVLRCDTESACDAVSTLILHTRLKASGNLGYRLVGLGPLIDNLEVQKGTGGTSLFVKTHLGTEELVKLVERVLGASPTPAPQKKLAFPPTPTPAPSPGAPPVDSPASKYYVSRVPVTAT